MAGSPLPAPFNVAASSGRDAARPDGRLAVVLGFELPSNIPGNTHVVDESGAESGALAAREHNYARVYNCVGGGNHALREKDETCSQGAACGGALVEVPWTNYPPPRTHVGKDNSETLTCTHSHARTHAYIYAHARARV